MFKRTTTINKILSIKDRFKIIQGGTSAGKTFAIMSILVDRALKEKNKKYDVVSQTYDHLRDGSMEDLRSILQLTNRWEDKRWNDSKKIYTFSTGTRIRFKSIDKIGKAKGPRRDLLFINEANYISFKIAHQLITRTNGPVYIDFNPVNRFWAHKEYQKKDNFIKLTYRDNEGLSNTIIKELESNRIKAEKNEYWKNWCKVYLDGEVGQLEGAVFQNWSVIDTIPNDVVYLGSGMDFGYSIDPTVCLDVYRWNGKLVIDEVFYIGGNLKSSEIVEMLEARPTLTRDERTIYCDSSDGGKTDEIMGYGVDIYKARKGKDSILFGIHKLQQYDILITKKSESTIKEFENYRWKENRDGNFINTPVDKHNHGIDSLRYYAEQLSDHYGEVRVI